MVDDSQIRARLSEWIDGIVSLSEFEDWFVPETWEIHKSNDTEAEDLADEIELSLSEYSGGYVSESQLKESLKELVNGRHSAKSDSRSSVVLFESNSTSRAEVHSFGTKVLEALAFNRFIPARPMVTPSLSGRMELWLPVARQA